MSAADHPEQGAHGGAVLRAEEHAASRAGVVHHSAEIVHPSLYRQLVLALHEMV